MKTSDKYIKMCKTTVTERDKDVTKGLKRFKKMFKCLINSGAMPSTAKILIQRSLKIDIMTLEEINRLLDKEL